MRKLLVAVFGLFALTLIAESVSAQTTVKPYIRKDGSYVQPHLRTNPNSTKIDNWSTKGNTNPYTGKRGTKSLYD